MKEVIRNKRAFTLIELLVVVLIIGILAAVAIPKYQVAVEKTRATQMLPMMRHIYDALAFYKLQNGNYDKGESDRPLPTWDELGIEPPAGFETFSTDTEYWNDTWYCFPNEDHTGYVYCQNDKHSYRLWMFQPDETSYSEFAGKRLCEAYDDGVGALGEKVCRALGGKELEETLSGGSAKAFEF